jgi:hypothetical protein
MIDSRIFDDQTSVCIKSVGNNFALFWTAFSLEKGLDIDDRDLEMGG